MKIYRYKKELDFSYALGTTLVFELLKNKPELVRRVFVSPQANETKALDEIVAMCKLHQIEVIKDAKSFNVLSPKENCFVIAEFDKFKTILDEKESMIVLVNPSDAGNLGTIVRTAVGLGVNNVAIVQPAVDVFSPKTIRASMGAIFHANVEYFKDIEEYMTRFNNHKRYAFMLQSAKDFATIAIDGPFAFIFGNEASGLPDEYANFCESVKIAQTDKIDSFSLPITVAMALYSTKIK